MELTRHASAQALLSIAGDYLVAREAEHNLALGILATLRDQPEVYRDTPYLATLSEAGRVALVAVRTPPHGPVLSEAGVPRQRIPAAIELLVADLHAGSPELPTILGPKGLARGFARRWSAVTGQAARLEMAERIYRLSAVLPPPRPAGGWRLAEPRDRELLREWTIAFHEEALPAGSPTVEMDALVERWVRHADRFAYLWEADGHPVSLVVAGARTPNGRRVGPVYTPPAHRGRGYAGALTAAASQDQLGRGATFCFLFTDLANPTPNRIYRRIGYEPVTDVDQYRFGR